METWKLFHRTFAGNAGLDSTQDRERLWFVSDHGNVKIVNSWNGKERFAKLAETGGHSGTGRYLALSINNAPEKYVHRLVATYFIPNPDNKRTVNHIDGDKHNNHINNLEWATYKENTIHGYETRKRNQNI